MFQNSSLVSCEPKCAATYCSAAVRCSRVLNSASALESVSHVIHLMKSFLCRNMLPASPWRDLANMGSITLTIRNSAAIGIAANAIGRPRRTREGRLGIDARRRSSALTSGSAGGAPLASRCNSVVPDSGAAGSRPGATSCARDCRQQLDRTEILIGVRCGQSWPRKIEQNEVPVRPFPDMRESGPDVHLFANRSVEFVRDARE